MRVLDRPMCLGLAAFAAVLQAAPALAQQPAWYVLAREDGCLDLKIFVKAERLPRAPVSPEDFAQMMRQRGEQVVVAPPADLPPALAGKVVQVKVGDSKAPLFVKEEVCRRMASDGAGPSSKR